MGIFNEQSLGNPFAKGIQGAPGVGFNLTSSGDYDMINKKLRNVGAPSDNTDAATKKYVDDNSSGSLKTSRLTVDSNIDMNNHRIKNLITPQDSKDPATKYYVDNTFLDRDGSYPMKGNLNMDNNRIFNLPAPNGSNQPTPLAFTDLKYLHVNGTNKMTNNINMDNKKIINLRTPTSDTDATNKKYVDDVIPNTNSFFKIDGSKKMTGAIDMNNNRILNLPMPTGNNQPTTLIYSNSNYLRINGRIPMFGDLNMNSNKIKNVKPPTNDSDAATKKYVDDNAGSPDLSDYLEKDGTVTMTGNLNLGNNKIVNLSEPTTDQQAANRGWVRKQIDRLDHHSGDASSGVFTITDPAAPTTLYLQYISGSSFDDFVFTTSTPGQPLVGWKPTANTYINKIEFQFGSRNINVDFLWFIPRDDSHSNSNFWVSGNRTGTWSLNIHKSWNYNMSGVKLRTHNNSNHTAITCQLFTDLPKAITKPLKRIEINTPKIVISGVVKADVNLGGNKIENLGVPTQDNEAVTKGYVDNLVHHTAVQPSHYKDEFSYLMSSGSQWTDEIDGGVSFVIRKIGELTPSKGNFHDYNHKVIFMSIIKNSQGKYIYKMGINFFRLAKNTDYTLCLEILNTDYNLWNNSKISVDKGTSTGLSIGNVIVKKLSHNYTDSTGKTKTMYYHRIIVNFQKLITGNKFFLHILVDILRGGYNLPIYPTQFLGVYIITYGIMGTFSNIDPDKVYDYHTAFDIKPTEVTYNVDINANNKKILNINLDRNSNNSAATVEMVKEIQPFTTNNFYRNYFEEFYDFTNASNYKVNPISSGIVFNYLSSSSGNTLRDISIPNKTIDNIRKEGLNINGYDISFSPTDGITKYTFCIVFYHWRNRTFSIHKKNPNINSNLISLFYSNISNKLILSILNAIKSFSLPSSFDGKKIILWLAEDSTQNITKAKISNYNYLISINSFNKNDKQKFTFTTQDGVLCRIMFSTNFYDTDSEQYHKVMLQEKLDGSYVI